MLGNKVTISNECHHILLLSQGTCVPNIKLVCVQTASLGWYACVAMETRCSKDLCTRYEVKSEELQTTEAKMYAFVAMVAILSYQQVIKFIVIT